MKALKKQRSVSCPSHRNSRFLIVHAPSAAALDPARWLAIDDDDVALGCECADPSLQIEEWLQQTEALPEGT